jgi:hypothetical protein
MRNYITKAIACIAVAGLFTACSKSEETISGTGSLNIEFENGYKGDRLELGASTLPTTNKEVLTVNEAKYIISNVVLTKEDGTVFTYPKADSYFIVDASNPESLLLNLSNVPAANYKSIQFGIGVDQAQYELGQSGIADFWAEAEAAGMIWDWASGFKFLAFEGTFTSPTVFDATSYMIHTGKSGTDYNYTTVNLDLPTNALVRTNITPQIHLSTDLSQIIDGTNKVNLSENNGMGMGAEIMGGPLLTLITANLSDMFEVEHVHNDAN